MRKATREQDLDGVLDGEPEGEDLVGADAGSTGSADCVEDDFACDDETFSAGFLGKCTEVSWMQRIAERMEAEQIPPEVETSLTAESRQLPEGPPSGQPTWREQTSSALTGHQEPKLSDFTYQADDFALPAPDQINELELPPRQIADLFVNAYFTTVHSSFPILRKKDFFRAYEQCFIPYAKPINRRWRAILNLVLAIGAKYTVLTGADNCDERDHWTFFARARSLSLDNGALWHLGDLEQVQVTGLATLYLIATEHINRCVRSWVTLERLVDLMPRYISFRAWHVCGLAVRYAYALALHLRNESQNMSDIQKEFRVRLWWSIYSLERLLEVRTGRPSAIDDPDVSAALPIPVEEDSFPTDHDRLYRYEYQPDRVKPTRFRRPDGQSKSPGGSARSSRPGSSKSTGATSTSASPSVISDLSPSQSSVRIGSSDSISRVVPVPNSATFFTHQIRLNMITHEICKSIFSASALGLSWANLQKKVGDFQDGLSQWRSDLPNLFNFQQRHRDQVFVRERLSLGLHYWSAVILATRPCLCKSAGRIPNESSKARDADMVAARTCVHAATEIINFLPDEPNPTGIYGVAPWWSLLHHLVQAASVLMIELSLRVEHVPDEAQQLLANSKKAVRWLWSMGERSTSSGRAWRTMDHLLHRVAPLVGGDTSDIPGINPNAALPFMCEATPYGVPQLYHHAIRHHSAHEINLPTAEMGLDIPPHFGIDPVYQPVNFSPNPYDQMDLHSRTFPDTDLMFPVTEDRENMDIGGHQ